MFWDDDDRWRMHDGFWGHGAGWLALTLLIVLLIGVAVALAVVLARGSSAPTRTRASSVAEAERILRRRFALGEIDEEEFRRRQEALSEYQT